MNNHIHTRLGVLTLSAVTSLALLPTLSFAQNSFNQAPQQQPAQGMQQPNKPFRGNMNNPGSGVISGGMSGGNSGGMSGGMSGGNSGGMAMPSQRRPNGQQPGAGTNQGQWSQNPNRFPGPQGRQGGQNNPNQPQPQGGGFNSNLPNNPQPKQGQFSYAAQIESQDFRVPATKTLRNQPLHGPTPTSIPGGQVVSTQALFSNLQSRRGQILIFDVLGGPNGLPGAQNALGAAQGGSFQDQTQQQFSQYLSQVTRNNKNQQMVFYCQNAQCWMSYNAALRAINMGYKQVYWYRGGIEAWQSARLPTMQRQR